MIDRREKERERCFSIRSSLRVLKWNSQTGSSEHSRDSTNMKKCRRVLKTLSRSWIRMILCHEEKRVPRSLDRARHKLRFHLLRSIELLMESVRAWNKKYCRCGHTHVREKYCRFYLATRSKWQREQFCTTHWDNNALFFLFISVLL